MDAEKESALEHAEPEASSPMITGYRYPDISIYIARENFSTIVDSHGRTFWCVNGTTISDNSVNMIIVPKNVTYLGGNVGDDMKIFLMENNTLIRGQ